MTSSIFHFSNDKPPTSHLPPPTGFTLLEMLLAISAFAIIVVIIGGAMRLGYRSQAAGEKRMESTERLRRTVDIISAQIQSSLPLTYDDNGNTKQYFEGDHKRMVLATNYSLLEGRKGYVVSEYVVKDDSSGKESLYSSENRMGTTSKSETLLLDGCDFVDFSYFEKGLTDSEDKWVEQWTSTDATPEKIQVRFKYRGLDHSIVVPIRVRLAT
jgi:prepilin-type N-terminal cleavage/methylation domain-containing protein